MKIVTLAILSVSVLWCCTKKEKSTTIIDSTKVEKSVIDLVERPKLYVNYFRDTLYEGMSERDQDSIVVVNTEYFRIPLLKVKERYLAMSDSSRQLTEKRSVRFLTYVAGYPTNSEPVKFDTLQEFLEYISERGYEKVAQSKRNEGIIYTFKKEIRK